MRPTEMPISSVKSISRNMLRGYLFLFHSRKKRLMNARIQDMMKSQTLLVMRVVRQFP